MFQEYPKMLHHADGRTMTVEGEFEESTVSKEWKATPEAAQAAELPAKEPAKEAARLPPVKQK